MTNEQLIQALENVKNWYIEHQDAPIPYEIHVLENELVVKINLVSKKAKQELAELIPMLTNVTKDYNDESLFYLHGAIAENIKVRAFCLRDQVCTKVVVGKKIIEEKVPRVYETIKKEVDDIRWECGALLE